MKRAPLVIAATAAGLGVVLSFHTRATPSALGTVPNSSATKSSSGSAVATGKPPDDSSSGSSSSGSSKIRTAAGPEINYGYGVISVSITVSGSRITKVGIASLTEDGNFQSQQIDQQSIPVLENEAVRAQSANIDGVSGATYTSAAFKQSLQGALHDLAL